MVNNVLCAIGHDREVDNRMSASKQQGGWGVAIGSLSCNLCVTVAPLNFINECPFPTPWFPAKATSALGQRQGDVDRGKKVSHNWLFSRHRKQSDRQANSKQGGARC